MSSTRHTTTRTLGYYWRGADGLNALVQLAPVFVKTEDQFSQPRRDVVLSVLQDRQERLTQGAWAGPDGNALLD
jgi:hypothetical protein